MWQIEVSLEERGLCGVSKTLIDFIVKESILRSGVKNDHILFARVGVASVDMAEMQALNKTYRGKDTPTDVLSFPEYPDTKSIREERRRDVSIGDVILSCEVIRQQAKSDGVSVSRELAYLLSHGVLHLLGYDHEPGMFSIQDEICDILKERKDLSHL